VGGAAAALVDVVIGWESGPPLVAAMAIPAITKTATMVAAAIRRRRRGVVAVGLRSWAGVSSALAPTVGSPSAASPEAAVPNRRTIGAWAPSWLDVDLRGRR